MKIGVFASFQTPVCTPENIIQVGTDAEALGLDSLWMGEHVVLFDEMEFPYPGSPDDIKAYEDMGLDRVVPLLLDPTPEAAKKRFGELEALVAAPN